MNHEGFHGGSGPHLEGFPAVSGWFRHSADMLAVVFFLTKAKHFATRRHRGKRLEMTLINLGLHFVFMRRGLVVRRAWVVEACHSRYYM